MHVFPPQCPRQRRVGSRQPATPPSVAYFTAAGRTFVASLLTLLPVLRGALQGYQGENDSPFDGRGYKRLWGVLA